MKLSGETEEKKNWSDAELQRVRSDVGTANYRLKRSHCEEVLNTTVYQMVDEVEANRKLFSG